ncbi:MAG: hypothetical protein KDB03_24635 [Planctomycetales bacterium]|nr:hypothetical protein [Planctomycetales bacterium]
MEEVPFEDRRVPLTEIDWGRSAWWLPPLTRAVQSAFTMTNVVFAMVGVWLIESGFVIAQNLFHPAILIPTQPEGQEFRRESLAIVLSTLPNRFQQLSPETWGLNELAYVSFCLVWIVAGLGFFGGILARRSLVFLGQQTVAPWGESISLVARRLWSILWLPGFYLIALFAVLLPVFVLGFIARLGSFGLSVAGVLLLILFVPLLFSVARILINSILCFPLAVCCIGAETKADTFEGVSRSEAYFFPRFNFTLVIVLALSISGWVGAQVFTLGIELAEQLILAIFRWSAATSQNSFFQTYANIISRRCMDGYWFSFFWAGAAAVYLILRKSVDHTELDELDGPDAATKSALPPIPSQEVMKGDTSQEVSAKDEASEEQT